MTANEIIAARLRKQAEWCERLGSPLYAGLLRHAAEDVLAGGPCAQALAAHEEDASDSALALRFMGAVHRLVLQGRAPELAEFYPSAGGTASAAGAWPAFRTAVERHAAELRDAVNRPVQTNEVGRSAALLGGFLEIARRTRLPLRLLEIGAAAGLNLRWDLFRYEQGSTGWGDSASPVRFSAVFEGALPPFDINVAVVERSGCDQAPIDPASADGQLTLRSYVWADQLERLNMLNAALRIAKQVPAAVEQARSAEWLGRKTATHASGRVTVVFHSIVWQYLSGEEKERMTAVLEEAGEGASPGSPLASLRMEPGADQAEVWLRLWPGGEDRLLAAAGFHGRPVRWIGA